MKSYTITEEQIKATYEATSVNNQEQLKEWFPEVFETKLEVGKWIIIEAEGKEAMFCIVDVEDENNIRGYGFTSRGIYEEDNGSYEWGAEYYLRQATKEEVEQALIKEAERRGFKSGVSFKSLINKHKTNIKYNSLNFDMQQNIIYYSGLDISGVLFKDGIWAEIIEDKKEMTIEEIEKQLGYSIKIVKYETK